MATGRNVLGSEKSPDVLGGAGQHIETLIASLVSASPFLGGLPRRELADVLSAARVKSVFAGRLLFREGVPRTAVAIPVSTVLKEHYSRPNGIEIMTALRGPGEILGLEAILGRKTAAAAVTPLEDGEVLEWSGTELRRLAQDYSELVLVISGLLADELSDATGDRVLTAASTADERVIRRLLELAHRFGTVTEAGIEIRLPLTQEEIGSWADASRESVTKVLRRLRAEGLVRTARGYLLIRDLERLSSRVENLEVSGVLVEAVLEHL